MGHIFLLTLMHPDDAPDFSGSAVRGHRRRALKHKKERIKKQDIKLNVMALYLPGSKSHHTGLLPYKENRKCDTAKHWKKANIIRDCYEII